jgi:hypothetical protein
VAHFYIYLQKLHVPPHQLADKLLLTLSDISPDNLSFSNSGSAAQVDGKTRHHNWDRHYPVPIPHNFYKKYIRSCKSSLLSNWVAKLYYSAHM